MIRYCCDRCKRDIDTRFDLRYTLTIEIEAAIDDETTEIVDDHDHLDDLKQMLDSADDLLRISVLDDFYQRKAVRPM